MTNHPHDPFQNDELDALLRQWHTQNSKRAAAGRDRLVASLRSETEEHIAEGSESLPAKAHAEARVNGSRARDSMWTLARLDVRTFSRRYVPAAASLALVALLAVLMLPQTQRPAIASGNIVYAPDGGRLDAFDQQGNVLGPCALKNTAVEADVAGRFTRVTVTQKYHNPFSGKIEAVYTFPLSHRAAVDRMVMTVTDPSGARRVVVGEVKEREAARQIYEAARQSGYVASLLEQERPNIFTQSVANIEPGAEVDIEISYVEILESTDGTFTFDFPMVVGPRYIPGYATNPLDRAQLPEGLTHRDGLVLIGPAEFARADTQIRMQQPEQPQPPQLIDIIQQPQAQQPGADQPEMQITIEQQAMASVLPRLGAVLAHAAAIEPPPAAFRDNAEVQKLLQTSPGIDFWATYADGSKEFGQLAPDGLGHIAARWFYVDPKHFSDASGGGFSPDTNRVPDASRITPMPVRPPTRAGHDISVTVTIDSGGPGLLDFASSLHEIDRVTLAQRDDNLPRKVMIALKDQAEIPNRDFVLSWKQTADTIEQATFAHMSAKHAKDEAGGGFFTLLLQPPARVDEANIRPRELVFVMDTSGSMSGLPIEKSKEVITRAIGAMRHADTFNLITFSGDTHILWDKPRPATAENKQLAKQFVESRSGGGGTEMMTAIDAALVQRPDARAAGPISLHELEQLPADGRAVEIPLRELQSTIDPITETIDPELPDPLFLERPDAEIRPARQWLHNFLISARIGPGFWNNTIKGTWETRDGRKVLVFSGWGTTSTAAAPMRIVMFLTDGYVGNDMEIVQVVRDNARTTRVFSFGIGNSVNRFLLESMARAGRGEVEYVLLESNPDEAVERFTRRIQSPVLTDIQIEFSDELQVAGLLTAEGIEIGESGLIPDLYDVKPLIIHGRYSNPGKGTLTITGHSGGGRWSKTIDLELPAQWESHDVIATLWARAKVQSVMSRDLNAVQQGTPPDDMRAEIVALGEQYQIMTQYTSFIAVEKSRMTIEGQPMLVNIPIELPDGTRWEGFFGAPAPGNAGGECDFREVAEDVVYLGLPVDVVDARDQLEWSERAAVMEAEGRQFHAWLAAVDMAGAAGQTPLGEWRRDVQQGLSGGLVNETLGREVQTLGQARGREPQMRAYRGSEGRSAPADPYAAGMYFLGATRTPPPAAPAIAGKPVTLGETLHDSLQPTTAPASSPVMLRARLAESSEGATVLNIESALRAGAVDQWGQTLGGAGGGDGFAPIGELGRSMRFGDELGMSEASGVANAPNLEDLRQVQQSSSPQSTAHSIEREALHRRIILESQFDRALSLAGEGKSAQALQVVDEILALDEGNSSARSLKAQLETGSPPPPLVHDRTAMLRRLFGTTEQPHFARRISIVIADLVEHDEVDTARTLLDALMAFDANFEIGRQMCAALDNASLDSAAKKAAIAKLAEQARQQVIDAVEAQLRDARIRDVVDPALHMFAFGAGLPESIDGAIYDGPTPDPEVATVIGTGVRVTILSRQINDELLATIRELGFKVEDVSKESKLIVGLAPFGRLDDLAVLAGVRRIEPTRVVLYEAVDRRR